jgi:hypothetical protein
MAKDNTPHISVNKLGEYMVSKAARQRQILHDQKFPQDYKGMYHREAAEAIAGCLATSLEDVSMLERQIRLLQQMSAPKVGTQRRINSNIDALETFSAMLDEIDLKGAVPELGPHQGAKLKIRNVDVSIRPEIILRGKGKSVASLIGATKIHFSRTYPLNEESAGYVSALLQEHCKARYASEGEPHGPYCAVIDVGSKTVYAGVKSTAQRMKDIEATCRNIADLWPSITDGD